MGLTVGHCFQKQKDYHGVGIKGRRSGGCWEDPQTELGVYDSNSRLAIKLENPRQVT